MPDMSGIFPVAVAAVLLFGSRMLVGTHARRASTLRRRSEAATSEVVSRRPAKLNLTLIVMWALFLACNAILMTQDPLYAFSLLLTAASSCKLRRVWAERYTGRDGERSHAAARAS